MAAARKATGLDPVDIGSYRGFQMSAALEDFGKRYVVTMQGNSRHQATLGDDPKGNITRLDNILAQMPGRLKNLQNHLEELYRQQTAAKAEMEKPFPFEQELREKTARLIALDAELNLDTPQQITAAPVETEFIEGSPVPQEEAGSSPSTEQKPTVSTLDALVANAQKQLRTAPKPPVRLPEIGMKH